MISRYFFFKTHEELTDTYCFYKKEIASHLKVLRVHQDAIDKILAAIDQVPSDKLQIIAAGALSFLTEITNIEDQCEPYYRYSSQFAEYFCTMTSLGFFAVAFYYKDYATLLAATFSTLSHAIPLKRLNDLDKVFAYNLFLKVMYNYDLLLKYPQILSDGFAAISSGGMDYGIRYCYFKYMEEYATFFHNMWHVTAALTLYEFNKAELLEAFIPGRETSTPVIKNMVHAVINGYTPAFLQPYLNLITDTMAASADKLYSLRR